MLVLSRKPGESVRVGDGVNITVLEIKGSKIRLGVTADKETTILRGELCEGGTTPRPSEKS
ncbi:MAG: carbon storage regulator [Thermoguttaceae bacterium]|jgi:carbon storage regulator